MSRRTKSILPITRKALKPQLVNDKNVQRKMTVSKQNQKLNHDRTARNLTSLNVGQSVRVRFGKTWKKGKVIQKVDDRSYRIQLTDGSIFRRNRSVLHATRESNDIEEFDVQVLLPQHSPVPVPQNVINTESVNNEGYTTRAGRLVRGNRKYTGCEWTK